jgi:hypothetical protein
MQYIFDNKNAPPALSEKDKQLVVNYLQSALENDTKSRGQSARKEQSHEAYAPAVVAVLSNDYPPAWARLALMQGYLQENAGPRADSTDLAFRDLGLAVLAHLQAMVSDLMPAWGGRYVHVTGAHQQRAVFLSLRYKSGAFGFYGTFR